MDKEGKHKFVANLNAAFSQSGCVVVAHYAGVTVAQMDVLRAKMRQAGGFIKVAKNRLAKLSLKNTDLENITDLFKGQTLIACSKDPIAAAKVICDFLKENEKLTVLGGAMGSKVLNVEAVKSLASLPSLDGLRSGLLGLICAPASRIARVVNSPAAGIARCLDSHARQVQEKG